MLIDEFMPEFDFSEKHETEVLAPVDRVFAAIWSSDMCESTISRWLFRLRGLPSENLTLHEIKRMNFEILGETQNEEILIGLAGKFWTPWGDMQKVNAENFRQFQEKGFAKAAWNFSLVRTDEKKTRLMTETRIRMFDETSRSRFAVYWTFVRPFSGWIREEMLRIIKRNAELEKSAQQMAELSPG